MKNIKLLCLFCLLLTGTTVFGGNGKLNRNNNKVNTDWTNEFLVLSECNLDSISLNADEEIFGAIQKKNMYPAYSFNVLKKVWYASYDGTRLPEFNKIKKPADMNFLHSNPGQDINNKT